MAMPVREKLQELGKDELIELILSLQPIPLRAPAETPRPRASGSGDDVVEAAEGRPETLAALFRLFPPCQVAVGVQHAQPMVYEGVTATLDAEPETQAIVIGGVLVNARRFAGLLDALHIPVDPLHAAFAEVKAAVVIHCGGRMTRGAGIRASRTRMASESAGRASLGVPKTWE